MAAVARYLLDTSAAARLHHPQVFASLSQLILRGLVATCAALDFEALYSAREPRDYLEIRLRRSLAYEYVPTTDLDWKRALQIHAEFAKQARWREVGIHDLLISAVAEREAIEIIHYDADFDSIAAFTGQAVSWVVPRGSVA